jgi:hypothetical protein
MLRRRVLLAFSFSAYSMRDLLYPIEASEPFLFFQKKGRPKI